MILLNNLQKVSDAMAVLILLRRAHLQQYLTRLCNTLYVCECVCVCVCVCMCESVSVSLTLGNLTKISVTIRKLAICEEWRAATLDVIVYLMLVVPCGCAPISLHDDHVCVRVWLPVCPCLYIATSYIDEHRNCCRIVRL